MITKTRCYINTIPCQEMLDKEFRLTRGPEPHIMRIRCTDTRFDKLTNPVTLRLLVPDESNARYKRLNIKNLFLVQRHPANKRYHEYILADLRYMLANVEATVSFNILGYGGAYRQQSLDNGRVYTVKRAAIVALEKLIANCRELRGKVKVSSGSNDPLLSEPLPDNLSNYRGGGFFVGKPAEMLPAILGDAGDMTVTLAGNIEIVDRTSGRTSVTPCSRPTIDGTVAEADNHWVRPKKVRVHMPMRIGGEARSRAVVEPTLTSQEPGEPSATNLPDPKTNFVLDIEMVMPKLSAAGEDDQWLAADAWFTDARAKLTAAGVDQECSDIATRNAFMGKRFFDTYQLTAPQRALAARISGILTATWRRYWRIRSDERTVDARRRYDFRKELADMQLGLLQTDGTTKANVARGDFVTLLAYETEPDAPMSVNNPDNLSSGTAVASDFVEIPASVKWVDPYEGILRG